MIQGIIDHRPSREGNSILIFSILFYFLLICPCHNMQLVKNMYAFILNNKCISGFYRLDTLLVVSGQTVWFWLLFFFSFGEKPIMNTNIYANSIRQMIIQNICKCILDPVITAHLEASLSFHGKHMGCSRGPLVCAYRLVYSVMVKGGVMLLQCWVLHLLYLGCSLNFPFLV